MLRRMIHITHDEAPTFEAGGTTAIGYASPSRGASDTSVWRLELAPGSASPVHSLDREEVFVALAGTAVFTAAGTEHTVRPGDCMIATPGTPFQLRVAGDEPFRAVACMPAGGKATVAGGDPVVPPWAA